jgi:hypothetical protein
MERFNSFTSDQIMITKRQASMMMASMLLFCLFVFIVGFFLGKRAAIDDFSGKTTHQALHDQIDFLLTTQSLQSSQDERGLDNNSTEFSSEFSSASFDVPVDTPIILTQPEKQTIPVMVRQEPVAQEAIFVAQTEEQLSNKVEAMRPAYAQLIGFGTKKAAQSFVARLKKHQVPVVLKTIISKTSSGKERVWYQAITPTYQSAQELQEQVAKVKRLEHIRDVDIKIMYVK